MKICIVRSDRMGDLILTLPVIQGIKQKNPQAIIHVVASQKNLKICKRFNLIDKTYEKLETLGIPRIGYNTDFMPGFWYHQTNKEVDYNYKSSQDLVNFLKIRELNPPIVP